MWDEWGNVEDEFDPSMLEDNWQRDYEDEFNSEMIDFEEED